MHTRVAEVPGSPAPPRWQPDTPTPWTPRHPDHSRHPPGHTPTPGYRPPTHTHTLLIEQKTPAAKRSAGERLGSGCSTWGGGVFLPPVHLSKVDLEPCSAPEILLKRWAHLMVPNSA